jgi:hypothetical protein
MIYVNYCLYSFVILRVIIYIHIYMLKQWMYVLRDIRLKIIVFGKK